MAPRATWKGFLNLSLVSVPVKAYSANDSSGTIRLNQLHTACGSRINLKTVCPVCGDISRGETMKGFEHSKNNYVIIDLDELEKLRSKDESRAIRIEKFVAPSLIDPIYYSESSYYLLPDGIPGQKPFALLRDAMDQKELSCIATIVLNNKEQLVVVRPRENLLCMTVLRYQSQLKSLEQFEDETPDASLSKEEFALANSLIDATTTDTFDISDYADTYTERLTALIESKLEGTKLVQPPNVESAPVVDLMEALKNSVAQARSLESARPKLKRVAKTKRPPAKSKKKSSTKSTEMLAEQLKRASGKKTKRTKKSG